MKYPISKILFLILYGVSEVHSQFPLDTTLEECGNQLFFLENSAYQPRKGEAKIRNPAFFWKSKLVEYGMAEEIYEKLDEDRYEYMLYAFNPKFGLEVYRICPRHGNYYKNGKIENYLDRGYRMQFVNKLDADLYLWKHRFYMSGNRDAELNEYLLQKRKERSDKFYEHYPIMSIIWGLGEEILHSVMYLIISAPLILLLLFLTNVK